MKFLKILHWSTPSQLRADQYSVFISNSIHQPTILYQLHFPQNLIFKVMCLYICKKLILKT